MGMIASVVTSQNWEKKPPPPYHSFYFLFFNCDVAQVAISP
jgi:hypothetical protein